MLDKIIDGISEKLNEVFGEEFTIYTDQTKQGFKHPCFFILCTESKSKQMLQNRYHIKNEFCIQYYPNEQDKRSKCYKMKDTLFHALEYITVDGDLLMGTKKSGEVAGNILFFNVTYDMFVYIEDEKTLMEELEINTTMEE